MGENLRAHIDDALLSRKAVSYTHLDVYKRQVVAHADIGHQRPEHIERGVVAQALLQFHVGGDLVEDVYKRQGLWRAPGRR